MKKMKRYFANATLSMLVLSTLLAGCSTSDKNLDTLQNGTNADTTAAVGETTEKAAREETKTGETSEKAKAMPVSIEMVQIPAGSFKYMNNRQFEMEAIKMGIYEITYEQWKDVENWAVGNGYVFANTAVSGTNNESAKNQPVTMVSLRDVIAWCNAASEKSGLSPVYYTDLEKKEVYRVSSNDPTSGPPYDITLSNVDLSANGYRLPFEEEWEYAARYIDGKAFTDVGIASGAPNLESVGDYSWYKGNSENKTHSVGQKKPNALGLYDMSGNVAEFCFGTPNLSGMNITLTKDNENAVLNTVQRGGRFRSESFMVSTMSVGLISTYSPSNSCGFRVVTK